MVLFNLACFVVAVVATIAIIWCTCDALKSWGK